MERRGKCLDMLVAYMLAQNTNMANARSGYRQLRRAMPTWNAVMTAPIAVVQRHLNICGLARMRARRLQRVLRTIKERHGKLDLEHLEKLSSSDAFDHLMSYFGIGPKTAACTLLFAFNMPLFPVDNGIHRMARRLRLVRPKARDAETGRTVQTLVDHDSRKCFTLHVLMCRHAKETCRPRNPKCRDCGLSHVCPHGQLRLRHNPPTQIERPRKRVLSRRASAGLSKHGDGDISEVIRRSS